MKLLFVTQALDLDDPELSAYHGWVAAFAPHYSHIEAVCLLEGRHALPENVRVHTLGKGTGTQSPLTYALRFLVLIWKLRNDYDAVFVHMNQEYLLLGGIWWKLLGKPAYLWRNHHKGSFLTDIAAAFCTKIFCTSKRSYTARYKKTVLMPVGIDASRFIRPAGGERASQSILFFSRMSPSKRAELLIDALALLVKQGTHLKASFVGSPLPVHEGYYRHLQERAASAGIEAVFTPGVPNDEAARIFHAHDVFVNCSPSGMYDKMQFEAAAAGCLVVSMSEDWRRAVADDRFCSTEEAAKLSEKIEALCTLSESEKEEARTLLRVRMVEPNTLATLAERLSTCMNETYDNA